MIFALLCTGSRGYFSESYLDLSFWLASRNMLRCVKLCLLLVVLLHLFEHRLAHARPLDQDGQVLVKQCPEKSRRDAQVFSTKRSTLLSFVLVCFLSEDKFSVAMNIGCAVFLFCFCLSVSKENRTWDMNSYQCPMSNRCSSAPILP